VHLKSLSFLKLKNPVNTRDDIVWPSQAIKLPRDQFGWSIFTPSTDSRILYVSNSGNDGSGQVYFSTDPLISNNPFKPSSGIKAYASFAAAFAQTRSGYPDWILVERGGSFTETINIRDGRSESEPFFTGRLWHEW